MPSRQISSYSSPITHLNSLNTTTPSTTLEPVDSVEHLNKLLRLDDHGYALEKHIKQGDWVSVCAALCVDDNPYALFNLLKKTHQDTGVGVFNTIALHANSEDILKLFSFMNGALTKMQDSIDPGLSGEEIQRRKQALAEEMAALFRFKDKQKQTVLARLLDLKSIEVGRIAGAMANPDLADGDFWRYRQQKFDHELFAKLLDANHAVSASTPITRGAEQVRGMKAIKRWQLMRRIRNTHKKLFGHHAMTLENKPYQFRANDRRSPARCQAGDLCVLLEANLKAGSGDCLFPNMSTRHYSTALEAIMRSGEFYSSYRLQNLGLTGNGGITSTGGVAMGDAHLVCTGPMDIPSSLLNVPYVELNLSRLAQREEMRFQCLFKMQDWHHFDISVDIALTDTITLQINSKQSDFEHTHYAFIKNGQVVAEVAIPTAKEVFHGLHNLQTYIISHLFYLIDEVAAVNPDFYIELTQAIDARANQGDYANWLIDICRQLCHQCEIDFIEQLSIQANDVRDVQGLKNVFGTDELPLHVFQEIIDVLPDLQHLRKMSCVSKLFHARLSDPKNGAYLKQFMPHVKSSKLALSYSKKVLQSELSTIQRSQKQTADARVLEENSKAGNDVASAANTNPAEEVRACVNALRKPRFARSVSELEAVVSAHLKTDPCAEKFSRATHAWQYMLGLTQKHELLTPGQLYFWLSALAAISAAECAESEDSQVSEMRNDIAPTKPLKTLSTFCVLIEGIISHPDYQPDDIILKGLINIGVLTACMNHQLINHDIRYDLDDHLNEVQENMTAYIKSLDESISQALVKMLQDGYINMQIYFQQDNNNEDIYSFIDYVMRLGVECREIIQAAQARSLEPESEVSNVKGKSPA